jgi:hypothetical protein
VPSSAAVEALLLPCLGWEALGVGLVPVHALSVSAATALQQGPLLLERAARHARFVELALGAVPSVAALARFAAALRRLWRVRWEPAHKEVLWRLAVDGVPLLAHFAPVRCGCAAAVGSAPDARLHWFWECPVAVAVRRQLC